MSSKYIGYAAGSEWEVTVTNDDLLTPLERAQAKLACMRESLRLGFERIEPAAPSKRLLHQAFKGNRNYRRARAAIEAKKLEKR